MRQTSTPAAQTAAKREVRETLKSAGIAARVASSATLINVALTDADDAASVLSLVSGSYVAEYGSGRLILIAR